MEALNLSNLEREYLRYYPEAAEGEDFCISEENSLVLVTDPLNSLSLRAGSDKYDQSSILRTFDLGDKILPFLSKFVQGECWIVIAFKLPHQ